MKAGRPTLWVAGLCAVLLALGGWWLLGGSSEAPTPPGSSVQEAVPAHAADALHDLQQAFADRDPAAAAALAPPNDATAGRTLAAVVDNATRLGLGDVTLRYVDRTGAVDPHGRWAAAVELSWAEPGATVRTEVDVALQTLPDRVAVRGLADTGRRPLWLTGPVVVERRPGITVVAADDTPAAALSRTLTLSTRAVRDVHAVLPRWRSDVVVELPATGTALDAALDAEPGEYAAVAAVTASVDGSASTDSPVRVYVNPEVFAGLDRRGAQIVLSHEMAHVATGAATTVAPLWLVEGFADHVALRDVDLPLSVTAAQVRDQVAREGVPSALPGPEEFDTHAAHLGAAYEAAWLACEVVVHAAGERALVDLYARVRRGTPVARALPAVAGMTEDELVRRWQQRLRDLS